MIAAESIFPDLSAEVVPLVDVKRIIETVGVEVLEEAPSPKSEGSRLPANHNDVVPYADTLRRVGQ